MKVPKIMANIFGFGQAKKISDGDGSTPNGNDGNNGQQNGNGGQNQASQDNNNGDDDSIFGNFVDADDADSEFDLGDDFFKPQGSDQNQNGNQGQGGSGDSLDDEQQQVLNNLNTVMKEEIQKAVMADSEFADFDPNDQTKIRKLLDTSMQRAAAAAVTAMMHPLKMTVEQAINDMRKEFQSGLATNTVKSKAEQAFEPIGKSIMDGLKDKNMVAFAKTNFQMVLQKTKDVQKAQIATMQLLKTMGILVTRDGKPARKQTSFGDMNDDFSGQNQNANRGIKTGNEALNDFFPQPNRR